MGEMETRIEKAYNSLTLLQQKELEGLFQRFSQVCKDPTGLPTKRGREHAISLVEGQNAVNVRPYRTPIITRMKLKSK
jgi:hypothetical protein